MVYRSFGIACSQFELAPKIAPTGRTGAFGAQAYLLAKDALARGLSAVVFRARNPLRILRQSQDLPVRLILNHRLGIESRQGHFTVLIGVEGETVTVHDPEIGPNTHMLGSDLLKLWQPLGTSSEITGNVIVALAKHPPAAGPCPQCGGTVPETIACPWCRKSVALRPASVLGCLGVSCPERAWEILFCPYCDADLMAAPALSAVPGKDFRSQAPAKPDESDEDPLKIQALSQEIDKYLALLLAANNGRPAPGAEGYFTQIRELQTQMLDLQKQEAAERQAQAAQPPPPPPPEPAPAPEPVAAKPPERKSVDWNELGRQLVRDMGYVPVAAPIEAPAKEIRSQDTTTDDDVLDYLKKSGLWKPSAGRRASPA
jgi:hypothetical protein